MVGAFHEEVTAGTIRHRDESEGQIAAFIINHSKKTVLHSLHPIHGVQPINRL
jgi:hypothetical protein